MARGKGEDGPHPVDRHVGRRVCEKRLALGYNQSDLGRALREVRRVLKPGGVAAFIDVSAPGLPLLDMMLVSERTRSG